MLSILQDIETTPVSIRFLREKTKTRVLVYKDLQKYTRSNLFSTNKSVIVLIPHKLMKKGHFICLTKYGSEIEYFSSLGGSPHDELVKLKQEDNQMSRILGSKYIYNRTKLQSTSNYNINTCGAYCLARVKLNNLQLKNFNKLFTRSLNLQNPDLIVSILALLHFVD